MRTGTHASLCTLQENLQDGVRGRRAFHDANVLFMCSWTMKYLFCLKKSCYIYLVKLNVKCFNNELFDEIFQFYLMMQSCHERPLTLTQSNSEVKLLSWLP